MFVSWMAAKTPVDAWAGCAASVLLSAPCRRMRQAASGNRGLPCSLLHAGPNGGAARMRRKARGMPSVHCQQAGRMAVAALSLSKAGGFYLQIGRRAAADFMHRLLGS